MKFVKKRIGQSTSGRDFLTWFLHSSDDFGGVNGVEGWEYVS